MASKLTPEEKKALAARKKEEKKRQQIEQAKQVKRDYLGRELKYGELTIKRHEREWKKMLSSIALPKMKQDLEYAWHNFERIMDCKDFTISLLMDEIRAAEEQRMLNVMNHIENINKLMELFHGMMDELLEDYQNEITRFHQWNVEEIAKLKLSAEEEEIYLKTMMFILKTFEKQQRQNLRAEYFSKLKIVEKNNEKIVHSLKGVLENKFMWFVKDMIQFLTYYERKSKDLKKTHDELKCQDEALQVDLASQLERIRKASEYIKVLRVRFSDVQQILGRQLDEVKDADEFFSQAFSALKSRLEQDRKTDVQKITHLTVEYNSTKDYLEELRKKVKTILQISEMCRKLETQKEKTLPFPVNLVEIPTQRMSHRYDKERRSEIKGVEEPIYLSEPDEYLPSLELFWQRVAQANGSRYAINEERECLKAENNLLKNRIFMYCQCVTCPIPEKNAMAKGIQHITEGAHEQKKYEKHRVMRFAISRSHLDIDE